MDEANIMKMFETFDFENDVNFQAGWKIISEQIDERNKGLTFIQAKVFYFNKHVARLDFDNYMSWIKTDYKTHVKTDRSQSYSVTADTSSTKINSEKLNQVQGETINSEVTSRESLKDITKTVLSHHSASSSKSQNICLIQDSSIDGNIKSVSNLNSSGDSELAVSYDQTEEECDLSFSQLAEMILSSKVIPGLKSINISPTNAPPTPSTMNRKAKPWEAINH